MDDGEDDGVMEDGQEAGDVIDEDHDQEVEEEDEEVEWDMGQAMNEEDGEFDDGDDGAEGFVDEEVSNNELLAFR